MLLTEKHKEKIEGIINCYDRINIKCTLGTFGYADGMAMFFNMISRKCFDFHNVFKPITERIKNNAERIASENGMEVEYIRNVKAFRKDDRIADIIEERGEQEGLIKIFRPVRLEI